MAYSSGQVSVDTTATELFTTGPAPAHAAVIYASATVYVGPSDVTASTGLEIPEATLVTIPATGAEELSLYAIASSGTATVSYLTVA